MRRDTILPNGMTITTDAAAHFNGVAINIAVLAGSVHEPDGLHGMAHLLEHLMFRSTTKSDESQLQKRIGQIGVDLNATTEEAQTSYTGVVLKDQLQPCLNLMGEMLSHPKLDPEDIALEKQIIENENCRGCAGCTMRDSVYGEAYPDQNLRHPIIGYEDTIEAITQDDLIVFYKSQYVSGNVIVSVAGDVDHDQVVEWVQHAFGDMTQGARTPDPEFTYAPGEVLIGSGSDRAGVRIMYDLSHLSKEQRRPYTLFEDILGGHGNSRLMDELREKRGLVYSCWSQWEFVGDRCLLFIDAWGEARKMKEIVEIIAQTACDTARRIHPEDLEASRQRCRAGIMMGQDDLTRRAARLIECIIDGETLTNEEDIALFLGVEQPAIEQAGRDLLALDPVIFLGGSHRQMPKFADIRAALKAGGNVSPMSLAS